MASDIHYPKKTLSAIDYCLKKDQGVLFKRHLEESITRIEDAYSSDNFPFRQHLGASVIGQSCARKLWYGFRWSKKQTFEGQTLRLFNRGHLEEARFIALLEMIGAKFFTPEKGSQFRITDSNGHFGGSLDGVATGIPDFEQNEPVLCEFKTLNDSNFKKLQQSGLQEEKLEHFVQMQVYMYKMKLKVGLYLGVNKNNDHLYGEIVHLNVDAAKYYLSRANDIIYSDKPPTRISESPGWYECHFCPFSNICHFNKETEQNCRTCTHSSPNSYDGQWSCSYHEKHMDIQEQYKGCSDWNKSEWK